MAAVKGVSFPAPCCSELRVIARSNARWLAGVRSWICVQSVRERRQGGCACSHRETQREDQPTPSTYLWKALPSKHLWAAAAEPLASPRHLTMLLFIRKLPIAPRAFVGLLGLMLLFLTVTNFSSFFGLEKSIFR